MKDIDQFGALAWRLADGRAEYLLVTSRRTSRWIFPKGNLDTGETPGQAAAREAAEEAGVKACPGDRALGRYTALKVSDEGEKLLGVELWPMEIEAVADEWPEKGLRKRRFVTVEEAERLLGQEDMRVLVRQFDQTIAAR